MHCSSRVLYVGVALSQFVYFGWRNRQPLWRRAGFDVMAFGDRENNDKITNHELKQSDMNRKDSCTEMP